MFNLIKICNNKFIIFFSLQQKDLQIFLIFSFIGIQLVNSYPSYGGYGNGERLEIEGTSRDVDETRFRNREYLDLSYRSPWIGRSNNYRNRYGSNSYRTNYKPITKNEEWDHVETREPMNSNDEKDDLMDGEVEMIDPSKASNQLAHLKFLPLKKRNQKSLWKLRNL